MNPDTIREYHEADLAYRNAFAVAAGGDEMVSLPGDVREARAHLLVKTESERLVTARVAIETEKAVQEDRWITAHEDMYGLRRGVAQ